MSAAASIECSTGAALNKQNFNGANCCNNKEHLIKVHLAIAMQKTRSPGKYAERNQAEEHSSC